MKQVWKIGVVGCGALGSYYGAKLCTLGHDVHFLLRSDYQAVRDRGVQIRSVQGDFAVRPASARAPEEIGPCDLVVIGLKTTANDAFARLVPPLVGPNTAVLTLQNGLGNEERLAALVGEERVMGGLCFVCLNRVAPGVVQHTAHGDILLGEFCRPPQARTDRVAQMFRDAGVSCKLAGSLERAHWEKLVWNVPFNGLGVAGAAGYNSVISGKVNPDTRLGPCLDTQVLLADPAWLALVRELMQEVVAAAGALRFEIPETVIENRIARTREMGAYKASTLLDFEHGLPLELESLFGESLRRARAAGLEPRRLAALYQVLAQLDLRRDEEAILK